MATRGEIMCVGFTKEGNAIVRMDHCALEVLRRSRRDGVWLKVAEPQRRKKKYGQPRLKLSTD